MIVAVTYCIIEMFFKNPLIIIHREHLRHILHAVLCYQLRDAGAIFRTQYAIFQEYRSIF